MFAPDRRPQNPAAQANFPLRPRVLRLTNSGQHMPFWHASVTCLLPVRLAESGEVCGAAALKAECRDRRRGKADRAAENEGIGDADLVREITQKQRAEGRQSQ